MLRAVFVRFLPGCALVLAPAVGAVGMVAADRVTAGTLGSMLTELLGMAAGFALVLRLCRSRLELVRGLGFRSFAAGMLAPVCAGACSWLTPGADIPTIILLSALAGAAAGVLAIPRLLFVRPRLARAGG
jgi:hypothetical protein